MVMVNVDDNLYSEIARIVKSHKIEFPTIKNFVERAIAKEITSINERDARRKKTEKENQRVRKIFSLILQGKMDELKKHPDPEESFAEILGIEEKELRDRLEHIRMHDKFVPHEKVMERAGLLPRRRTGAKKKKGK
ncbi:MAG: hypothetical protein J7K54_00365 [Candidatus Aenigmarchaeota archaeon]|nr:hypothetical protein [Candidatus Aenigmarchaeota archaeon]